MVNFDHYKEARELAEELRKEKIDHFANQIIKAMEEGSTGTEIFMTLRWNIEQLLKTKELSCQKRIKDKAICLYRELGNALKQ
jgi:hypothetical protein